MSTATPNIDFDRLLRLRLVVARYGEMDAARWWNTGDAGRRTALLGRAGSVLMSRGFPRTHRFAQARLVFEVARARCAEVFDPPGCVTLWNLPPAIEDQFDARWARWLDHEEAKLDGLTREAGGNPSAAQLREIEQQENFIGALQALTAEVTRVAPLWKPNLHDGVGAARADVLAATGLSDADWNKAIAALLDSGDVTRTGQKRGTRYHRRGGS